MHISKIEHKSAGILAATDLNREWYHDNIKSGAQAMVKAGYPHAMYMTQWQYGHTLWKVAHKTHEQIFIARPDGIVDGMASPPPTRKDEPMNVHEIETMLHIMLDTECEVYFVQPAKAKFRTRGFLVLDESSPFPWRVNGFMFKVGAVHDITPTGEGWMPCIYIH